MKILILVDQVVHAGGLERALAHKVSAWCGNGYAVEIVTIDNGGRMPFYPFPASVMWRDLDIRYDRGRSLLSPANLVQAVRHFFRLRSAARQSRSDIVINCGYGYDFYFTPVVVPRSAFLIKENHSSRFVQTAGSEALATRLKRRLRLFFDERYDACVFLSPEEATLGGARNGLVIPNPTADVATGSAHKEKVVIAAGRICHFKGFDRLLRAWAVASPQVPEWRLEIYGDDSGSDLGALKQQMRSLGLTDRASVFPATRQILEKIAQSGVFAMTSRTECFPMVLLESMQLGVPIVAFDCPTGPRNILMNGLTGMLVPDGDIEAFAAALVHLIGDEELRARLASNARREVRRYSLAQIGSLWGRLFERASTQ